jgi:hypothetical protein
MFRFPFQSFFFRKSASFLPLTVHSKTIIPFSELRLSRKVEKVSQYSVIKFSSCEMNFNLAQATLLLNDVEGSQLGNDVSSHCKTEVFWVTHMSEAFLKL